jgi:hypothetical protein
MRKNIKLNKRKNSANGQSVWQLSMMDEASCVSLSDRIRIHRMRAKAGGILSYVLHATRFLIDFLQALTNAAACRCLISKNSTVSDARVQMS